MRRKFLTSGFRFAALVLSTGVALGCAGDKDEMKKRLASMQDEIVRLQGDQDMLVDRVTGLETQVIRQNSARGRAAAEPQPQEERSDQVERPRLKVIRLGPRGGGGNEEDAVQPSEEDDAPRPILRGSGDDMRVDEVPNKPRPKKSRKRSEAPRSGAVRDYQAAYSLVKSGDYDEAEAALSRFIERHPTHPYADNALYWRGECHYARGAYSAAAKDFRGVFTRYPQGNKVPDALLKLGYAQVKRGALHEARATFSELSHNFPTAEATRMIPRI